MCARRRLGTGLDHDDLSVLGEGDGALQGEVFEGQDFEIQNEIADLANLVVGDGVIKAKVLTVDDFVKIQAKVRDLLTFTEEVDEDLLRERFSGLAKLFYQMDFDGVRLAEVSWLLDYVGSQIEDWEKGGMLDFKIANLDLFLNEMEFFLKDEASLYGNFLKRCVRGFKLKHGENVEDFGRLFAVFGEFENLEYLEFEDFVSVPDSFLIEVLKNLKGLKFRLSELADELPLVLRGLSSLEKLEVENLGRVSVENCPQLRSIFIKDTIFNNITFIGDFENVSEIAFEGVYLISFAFDFSLFPSLEFLRIKGYELGGIDLTHNHRLKKLVLQAYESTLLDDDQNLELSGSFSNLESVEIFVESGVDVSSECLEQFVQSRKLSEVSFGGVLFENFDQLSQLELVKKATFRACDFDPSFVFPRMPAVEELVFVDCLIDADEQTGVKIDFSDLKTLERLEFDDMKVDSIKLCSSLRRMVMHGVELGNPIDFDECRGLESLGFTCVDFAGKWDLNLFDLHFLKELYLEKCGDLKSVNASGLRLLESAVVRNVADLSSVDFSGCKSLGFLTFFRVGVFERSIAEPCDLEFVDLTGCSGLSSLYFSGDNCSQKARISLEGVESLENLDLSGVDDLTVFPLAEMECLQHLCLSGVKIGGLDLVENDSLKNLELVDFEVDGDFGLPKQLEHLMISHQRDEQGSWEIGGFSNLETLEIKRANCGSLDLRDSHNLRTLKLNACFGDTEVDIVGLVNLKEVAIIPAMDEVCSLRLNNSKIEDLTLERDVRLQRFLNNRFGNLTLGRFSFDEDLIESLATEVKADSVLIKYSSGLESVDSLEINSKKLTLVGVSLIDELWIQGALLKELIIQEVDNLRTINLEAADIEVLDLADVSQKLGIVVRRGLRELNILAENLDFYFSLLALKGRVTVGKNSFAKIPENQQLLRTLFQDEEES